MKEYFNKTIIFVSRIIDSLTKRGLLHFFNHQSSGNKNNDSYKNASSTSNQLQNKSLVTKNQRLINKPYRIKSNSTLEDRYDVRKRNSKKQNNIQLASPNNLHRDCNKEHHIQKLSESSNKFEVKTQSSSLTLPLRLSNVLIPTSYDTDCLWAKVTRTEEVQLRNAAWYQPGLSR